MEKLFYSFLLSLTLSVNLLAQTTEKKLCNTGYTISVNKIKYVHLDESSYRIFFLSNGLEDYLVICEDVTNTSIASNRISFSKLSVITKSKSKKLSIKLDHLEYYDSYENDKILLQFRYLYRISTEQLDVLKKIKSFSIHFENGQVKDLTLNKTKQNEFYDIVTSFYLFKKNNLNYEKLID